MKKRTVRLLGLTLAALLTFEGAFVGDASANKVYADDTVNIEEASEENESFDNAEEISEEYTGSEQSENLIEESEVSDAADEEYVNDDEIAIIDEEPADPSADALSEDSEEVIEDDFESENSEDESVKTPLGGLMDVQVLINDEVDSKDIVFDINELYEEYQQKQVEDSDFTVEDVISEDGVVFFNDILLSYASNYVYNKLPAKRQLVWKAFDNVCDEAMRCKKTYNNKAFAYISAAGVFTSDSDFKAFYTMYKYSNPQYFFLDNSYSRNSDLTSFSLCMYTDMLLNDTRGNYRAAFEESITKTLNRINSYLPPVDDDNYEYMLAYAIQQELCAELTYNQKAVDNNHVDEESEYTQSAFSTFVLGSTVCAGYALGAALLFNAKEIDSIAVTSSNHAFNKVRLYGTWYNLDTTWADQSSGVYYKYFLKSDSTYSKDGTSHVVQSQWKTYAPACKNDSASSGYTVKYPSKPTTRVQNPVIKVDNGKVTITCATSGATIYYGIDGTRPRTSLSQSLTRCNIYSGPFTCDADSHIRAVAMRDGMFDSGEEIINSGTVYYYITYVLNGGNQNSSNPNSYEGIDGNIVFADPTREGYIFDGWYTNSKFTEASKITKLDRSLKKNITIYAKWKPIEYNIVFHIGNQEANYPDFEYDKEYSMANYTAYKRGYTLLNWNTKKDGSGVKYSPTGKFKNLGKTDGCNVHLYAQFQIIKYTITYSLNGGKNHPDNKKEYYVTSPTIDLKDPCKVGYCFYGWKDAETNAEVYSIPQGSICNVKLIAVWKPIEYFVDVCDPFRQTGFTMTCEYGKTYKLPAAEYRGYQFMGWYTQQNGKGKKYSGTFTNLTPVCGKTISLCAYWKIVNYTISYSLNGGKNNSSNPKNYTVKSNTITFAKPTRKGYIFEGWYKDNKFKTAITSIPKSSVGNVRVYAKWKPIKYKLIIHSKLENKDREYNCTYDTECKVGTLPTVKGYTLTSWNAQADGKGKKYSTSARLMNLTTKDDSTVHLYAMWKLTNYRIKYNLYGGKNNSANPSNYYMTTATITFKNPTRRGYIFEGWYKDSGYSTPITKIEKGSTTNVEIFAKWKPIKYTIKFDGNGAKKGSMSDMENCKYDTSYSVPDCGYERDGYIFLGWNTMSTSRTGSIKPGASVKNLSSTNGGSRTLYAIWKKK